MNGLLKENMIKMSTKISSLVGLMIIALTSVSMGQEVCKTWNDSPQKEEGENAHSVYRQALKTGDWQLAYENWQIAYEIAPAADGKRDFHFTDGIKIYQQFMKESQDEAKKAEYKKEIIRLYKECAACYEAKVIEMNDCDDACYKAKVGYFMGRLGYEMFYNLNAPYEKNYEVFAKAINYNKVGAEYIVLEPMAHIAVYQYQQGKLDKDQMVELYDNLMALADYNIENDVQYGEYYESTKIRTQSVFKQVEKEIFDCDYFKENLVPKYEANPEDFEVLKYVYSKLKTQGCAPDDPVLMKIKREYEILAKDYNASVLEEYEANNPHVKAKRLYDEGKYKEAIKEYEKAVAKAEAEGNVDKQGEYYFRIASIQGRKLKSFESARSNARKAAKYKENWGRPYMLIGDLYAMSSRSCGKTRWEHTLAVLAAIDKYYYAKSIDPEVADEASSRMAKYNGSKPDKEEGFMMGYQKGQKLKVPCWIGETITLRFK
jgi:tetratricopeptide (TPR) repeat protein